MDRNTRRTGMKHPSRTLAALLAMLLLASGLALAVVPASRADAGSAPVETITGGDLVWGVKETFRNYIVTIADGDIEVGDGATQAASNGVFTFPVVGGGFDAPDVAAATEGFVRFRGHYVDDVALLDVLITDIRVVFDDTEGILIADVTSRPYEPEAEEPPAPVVYEDVDLAALDLVGVVPVDGTWTGIPSMLTAEGVAPFADFYPAETVLDPLTVTIETETATTEVTPNTGIDPVGPTEVTVTGSGFDPNANISTRPPVPPGMPTGVYVVFGRFLDEWQPSSGAPSSARKVIDQKWALPPASIAAVELAFPGACTGQCIPLNPDGSFETTLEVFAADVAQGGNYGVFTYAAGGAAPNAAQETYEPISFTQLFPDVSQDNNFFGPISWLDEEGITEGFDDGTFRPEAEITRQAVAAFLWRMDGEPAAPPGHPTFTDVPVGHPFYEAISWAAAVGITEGFDDDTFRPQNNITREAMAAFIWRDAGEPEPPEDHPTFTDVPEDHPFYEAISWLAGREIANGFDDDTFRPGDNITRQAMAAFLYRYAHLEPLE